MRCWFFHRNKPRLQWPVDFASVGARHCRALQPTCALTNFTSPSTNLSYIQLTRLLRLIFPRRNTIQFLPQFAPRILDLNGILRPMLPIPRN